MKTTIKTIQLGNIAVRNRTKEQILDAIDLQVENTLDIDMMQTDAHNQTAYSGRTYVAQTNNDELLISTKVGWDKDRLWMNVIVEKENEEYEYTLIAEGSRTVYHR